MPPKDLNQGISASRAGSAQKKPPTAIRGRPLGRGRGGSRSSTGRDPNRPSVLQRPQDIKGKARQRQADVSVAESDESRTSISSSDDEDWTRIERILLDKTLHLHSISPLHFSSLPGSIRDVSEPLFKMLKAELYQYVNLRLSDGLGFLEGANTISNARDTSTADFGPPSRRRRTDTGKVGKVRISYLQDQGFLSGFRAKNGVQPWVIELEIGKPAIDDGVGSSRRPPAEATSAELCLVVFLPSRSASQPGLNSYSYPLILTKAPSASASPESLMPGAASNVGRLVLSHTLEWLQKRFDCRIASGTGAMSIASLLKGPKLETLAEVVVSQTRVVYGSTGGQNRSSLQRELDGLIKPVELSFAFPAKVADPSGRKGDLVEGPSPELSAITLTVPWDVCMQLLDGLDEDQPLLPALNHYLSSTTSISFDQLDLVRIGVAGVNIGVGSGSVRVKVAKLPSEADIGPSKKRKDRGDAVIGDDEKRRAGLVMGLLRDLADKVMI